MIILILGAGVTGQSVLRLAQSQGLKAVLFDDCAQQKPELFAVSVVEDVASYDVVVVSPGIPLDHSLIAQARAANVLVMGDIEFVLRYVKQPQRMIAVTGTNGKTTTVHLIHHVLQACGQSSLLAGNVGVPLADVCQGNDAVWVLELSSFQLDLTETLKPDVAIILNVTEDHLDRYPSMEEYAASKARIFINQDADDVLVLLREDPFTSQYCAACVSSVELFDAQGDELVYRSQRLGSFSQLQLWGIHQKMNVRAALLALAAFDLNPDQLWQALCSFTPLKHRMQVVATVNDVLYVNDSKATNVDAMIKAVNSYSGEGRAVILLFGGRYKSSLEQLRPSLLALASLLKSSVKHIIAFGEVGGLLHNVWGSELSFDVVQTLDQAVDKSFQRSASGDVVLLSPGCASFDQYQSYAQRGDHFRALVEQHISVFEGSEP